MLEGNGAGRTRGSRRKSLVVLALIAGAVAAGAGAAPAAADETCAGDPFSATAYMGRYQDVADAVYRGDTTPCGHYENHGKAEGRNGAPNDTPGQPPTDPPSDPTRCAGDPFSEAYYLDRYGDVADAVRNGHLSSGCQHYEAHGKAEGRRGTPDEPTQPPPSSGTRQVFTIGDSYAAGTGIHRWQWNYTDPGCWREEHDTPGPKIAHRLGIGALSIACKGDEVNDVWNQFNRIVISRPSGSQSPFAGSLFLVSAGGNDIRTVAGRTWPQVVQACLTDVLHPCHKDPDNQAGNLATIDRDLRSLYGHMATNARSARIRVLGYPRPMSPNYGGWFGSISCRGSAVGHNEAVWLDERADELNNTVRSAVEQVGREHPGVDIRYVNVSGYFSSGACDAQGNAVVGNPSEMNAEGIPITNSFHPSPRGYGTYERAINDSL